MCSRKESPELPPVIVEVSHRVLTHVSAEVGGFEAIRCLAWLVAHRVQQAVTFVSSRDVGSRGGVGCAILAKRGARGRLMAAGATRAHRRGRGRPVHFSERRNRPTSEAKYGIA